MGTDLLKPNGNDLLFATAFSFINRIGESVRIDDFHNK